MPEDVRHYGMGKDDFKQVQMGDTTVIAFRLIGYNRVSLDASAAVGIPTLDLKGSVSKEKEEVQNWIIFAKIGDRVEPLESYYIKHMKVALESATGAAVNVTPLNPPKPTEGSEMTG